MPDKIDTRSSGPETSPEEREAIANQVSCISEGILLWKELPVPSVLGVDLMAQRVQELTEGICAYSRVVDLSAAARPAAPVRRRLREMLAAEDHLRHIGVFTGKNVLINVALKFVFAGMAKNISLSVHRSYEEALQACKQAMEMAEFGVSENEG